MVFSKRSREPEGGGRDRRGARADAGAILVTLGALAASAVMFEAAATWKLPALLGAAPSALLLLFAWWRYRASP